MAERTPDQRNYSYLIESVRTGIHQPILAALHAAHHQPPLTDGETGLGITPANRIPPSQVNTFPEQVQYAANTIRSLTSQLTAEGWQGKDVWNSTAGHYSDRFLHRLAEGYSPPATDLFAAQLEPVAVDDLIKTYQADIQKAIQAGSLPSDVAYLDKALLTFIEGLPGHYERLSFQRQALLEVVRLWRKLDNHQAVAIALQVPNQEGVVDEAALDKALLDFIRQAEPHFAGYPNQREGLIRLVQLWCQLESREAVIQQLAKDAQCSSEAHLDVLDPAIIKFIQQLPEQYRGRGDQRFALTESYRLWHHFDSRTAAIAALGLNPQTLVHNTDDPATMAQAAVQVDQLLLDFWTKIPVDYKGTDHQRDVLIGLVMLWRHRESRDLGLRSLFDDLRQMERANRNALEAMPSPVPPCLPSRPSLWTSQNIQLSTSIVPSGSFTWAEATRGGTQMPSDQVAVDAIVRAALMLQEARDRIGRPFVVTNWYCSPEASATATDIAMNRYAIGDAIDFYCDGLTGQQLYWAIDPWWPGGLGRYAQYPYLCYLDARSDRVRWLH